MKAVTAGIFSALKAAVRTNRKMNQKATVPTSFEGLAPGLNFSTYPPAGDSKPSCRLEEMLSEAVTTDKGRAPSGRERRWTLDWDVPLGRRSAVSGYKRSSGGICVTDGFLAESQSSHARNCGHAVNTTMRAPTDEELVDRARVGDLGSFERLVERHRDVVYRVAAPGGGPAAR